MTHHTYIKSYLEEASDSLTAATTHTAQTRTARKITGDDLAEYNKHIRNAIRATGAAVKLLQLSSTHPQTKAPTQATTADYLAAYRDELTAARIDQDLINELIRDAASHLIRDEGFTVRKQPTITGPFTPTGNPN
ncbi:hypothetical protein [Rhodococcus erythropolis]|uniref:hypothetical protein n=1 Tax=Rhodococcus erythropolis TaxID=1833 RepID=UPI001BE74FDC|nr:hypothetical protein [Rhodococcus erythropolis]MBT2266445.1 hypothetical protein [Rhodococcus erythropolis]